MLWVSNFDSSYSVSDLPETGLDTRDPGFVKIYHDTVSHYHFDIVTMHHRNGSSTPKRIIDSPDIGYAIIEKLTNSRNESDWPLEPENYNFTITNWLSCFVAGTGISRFELDNWTAREDTINRSTAWADGWSRLPRVPLIRELSNNAISWCFVPKTVHEISNNHVYTKHTIPYRFEYFNISKGETLRTRICDSDYAGHLVLHSGSIKDFVGPAIAYPSSQHNFFTASEDTIAVTCVRY
jgi:hypothetical protein